MKGSFQTLDKDQVKTISAFLGHMDVHKIELGSGRSRVHLKIGHEHTNRSRTVHGGVTDWGNDGLGIISLSNELWNEGQYFTSPELKEQQKDPNSPIAPGKSRYFFNDKLEFGEEMTDWKPFKHPQFGDKEGLKKFLDNAKQSGYLDNVEVDMKSSKTAR
jgi:hypothetical protein